MDRPADAMTSEPDPPPHSGGCVSSKDLDRERERVARVLPRMFAAGAVGALVVAVMAVYDRSHELPLALAVLFGALLFGAVLGPPAGRRSTDTRDLDPNRGARTGALFVKIAPVLVFVGLLTFRRASGVTLIAVTGFAAGFYITYAATLRRRLPARLAALQGKD